MLHTHHREFFFVTPPTGSADSQHLLTPLGFLLGFFFFRPAFLFGGPPPPASPNRPSWPWCVASHASRTAIALECGRRVGILSPASSPSRQRNKTSCWAGAGNACARPYRRGGRAIGVPTGRARPRAAAACSYAQRSVSFGVLENARWNARWVELRLMLWNEIL
jgi:hypothetical protein